MILTEEQIKKFIIDLEVTYIIEIVNLKEFLKTYDFQVDKTANFLPPHGTEIVCPTCSSPGKYDGIKSPDFAFDNSIWYNELTEEWACWDCYLK